MFLSTKRCGYQARISLLFPSEFASSWLNLDLQLWFSFSPWRAMLRIWLLHNKLFLATLNCFPQNDLEHTRSPRFGHWTWWWRTIKFHTICFMVETLQDAIFEYLFVILENNEIRDHVSLHFPFTRAKLSWVPPWHAFTKVKLSWVVPHAMHSLRISWLGFLHGTALNVLDFEV